MTSGLIMFFFVVAVLIIMGIYLVFAINSISSDYDRTKGKKLFFNGVLSVFQDIQNLEVNKDGIYKNALDQINIIYNNISSKYFYKKGFTLSELINDFFVELNTKSIKIEIDNTIDKSKLRHFLMALMEYKDKDNLFTNISKENTFALNQVNQAINAGNSNEAKINLEQLSHNIKTLEDNLNQTKSKKEKINLIISIASIIMTVIFGVLSVVFALMSSSK